MGAPAPVAAGGVNRAAHPARERGDTPELDAVDPLSKNRVMLRATRRFAPVLPFLVALAAPAGAEGEAPEVVIYKWVDENGIAHYTTDRERIPSSLRDRIPEQAPPRDEDWARSDVTSEAPAAEAPAVDAGPDAPSPASADPALEARIAALEAEIARDEEQLKALISDAERARGTDLAEDPAFRELARRLPKLQADLRTLRDRRDAASPPSPAGP